MQNKRDFIIANTRLMSPPHVPEIQLHLADEAHDLWLKTDDELTEIGLPPPFWAFAWAGGQGLARYIIDNPQWVAGKNVLDFAAGSGLVAIAAKMAGAANVTANDIDPFCSAAVELNCKANAVQFEFTRENLFQAAPDWLEQIDIILAGDVFYDLAMASDVIDLFTHWAAADKTILIGDPGRAYLPKSGLLKLAEYAVPVTRALEDSEIKKTAIWKLQNSGGT